MISGLSTSPYMPICRPIIAAPRTVEPRELSLGAYDAMVVLSRTVALGPLFVVHVGRAYGRSCHRDAMARDVLAG